MFVVGRHHSTLSTRSTKPKSVTADSHATTQQVINRLAAIIRQIDETPDIKRAFELNTYAKAEIGRILNLRVRLMAANRQREAAHGQHLAADRLAERDFMRMGVVR